MNISKYPKNIGIMQGRLSKPLNEKIQSFPIDNWENEFKIASEIGYTCIEWVIDSNGIDNNPLFFDSKRKVINTLMNQFNISIPAVCHDQLMDITLHSKDENTANLAFNILNKTMDACENMGIKYIEIPLVGNSALKTESDFNILMEKLYNLDKKAKEFRISFILETDLSPEQNVSLMKSMEGLSVGMNFDMGNSAYWGFNPDIELIQIGPWIKNVHVKDCTPKDYTLPLGEGNVDFKKVFNHLKKQKYDGLFILQAAPAPYGQEIEIAKNNYNFTKKQLSKYYES
jgi:L-ribulose-5-phosphate 3-epimerase